MAATPVLPLPAFLSTLSLRRATGAEWFVAVFQQISIHALLAESDQCRFPRHGPLRHFYPRSPCGERPDMAVNKVVINDISIHALLAESDMATAQAVTDTKIISIHALLAESDHYDNYNLHCVEISIHALLAESDIITVERFNLEQNFYPRSPCGERRATCGGQRERQQTFLSTLSLRRATPNNTDNAAGKQISIHALLAESDPNHTSFINNKHNFYPRSPCGERQHAYQLVLWVLRFLSTLSLRRATPTRPKTHQ